MHLGLGGATRSSGQTMTFTTSETPSWACLKNGGTSHPQPGTFTPDDDSNDESLDWGRIILRKLVDLPGLVNIQKTNWKITIFLMGKLTISMAMFTSLLYVYQRVQICMTCKYILMVIAAFSEVMTGAFPEEVEGPTFQIHALTYVPAGQVRWMSSMM